MRTGYMPLLIQHRIGYSRRHRLRSKNGFYADLTGWELAAQVWDADGENKLFDVEVQWEERIITGPGDWHYRLVVTEADAMVRHENAVWDLLATPPNGSDLLPFYVLRGPVQYLEAFTEAV